MAMLSDMSKQVPMIEADEAKHFNMNSLKATLPQNRRGLSRYYSGKARSFTCMADVQCLEDLKKPEIPEAKKRKKYSERQAQHFPPAPCRRVSSTTHFATPRLGF